MSQNPSYRNAFVAAVFFHLFLAFMLLAESHTSHPVLTKEVQNEPGEIMALDQPAQPQPEIVRAVSVDNKEIMETVNRLKNERAMQLKAEQSRQQNLAKQAEAARKERLMEQQRLVKLKDEAAKLAIARKKEIEEEQKRLKQLTMQKEQESKRLQELKNKQQQLEKKQQQEADRQAELKKKQLAEKAIEDKARADQAAAELAHQKAVAAEKESQAAANRAKMAGEVDKYKAMIVNAISRRWILPENVDSSLSSQFRIRLAPDGAVLEVSLTRSSGDPILDRSAQTAIYKASPLPVPSDPATFDLFRDISLTVRPENVRG